MKAQIVSFTCVLKDKMGKVISSTFNHDVLTGVTSEADGVLSGLVQGLQDLKTGERRRIVVPAEKGYGFYDPKRVIQCSRADLFSSKTLRMGDRVQLTMPEGKRETYRVIDFDGEFVTLDANHPLAGQDLVFEIETVSAREATPDEIADLEIASTAVPQTLH